MLGVGVGVTSYRRRAGAALWTPADWGTRRRAHYSAREGVTVTGSNVSALADLSGNGHDLAAIGSASTQPIVSTSLGATCLTLDGNDHLKSLDTPLPTADGATYTVYMACRYASASSGRCVMATASAGGSRLSQGVAGAIAGTRRVEDWIAGVAFSTSSAVARTTGLSIILSTRVGSTGSARMWVNGAEVTLSSAASTVLTPSGALYLGSVVGTTYFLGDFFETAILTGAPGADDIAHWFAHTLALIGV